MTLNFFCNGLTEVFCGCEVSSVATSVNLNSLEISAQFPLNTLIFLRMYHSSNLCGSQFEYIHVWTKEIQKYFLWIHFSAQCVPYSPYWSRWMQITHT